jgi:chemotaxis protein MotB
VEKIAHLSVQPLQASRNKNSIYSVLDLTAGRPYFGILISLLIWKIAEKMKILNPLKSIVTSGIMLAALSGCVSSGKYQSALEEIARIRADSTTQANTLAEVKYNTSKEIASAEQTIRTKNRKLDSLRSIAEHRRKMLEKISTQIYAAVPALEENDLETYEDKGYLHISLPHRVLFNTGEATLSNDGTQVLREISGALLDFESDIMILGHADSVPFVSGPRDNWQLSFERAQHVLNAMVDEGVSPDNFIIAGKGIYDPMLENNHQVGRLLNRRIELVIMPDVAKLESVMEELSEYDEPQ